MTDQPPQQPTPPRRRQRPVPPVESFGPELMAALMQGAIKPFTIQLKWREAVRFRQRIHQLRDVMRKSKHEKYSFAARVKVTISWPDDAPTETNSQTTSPVNKNLLCDVTLAPHDSEFASAIQRAGVQINQQSMQDSGSIEVQSSNETSVMDLEKLLNDL